MRSTHRDVLYCSSAEKRYKVTNQTHIITATQHLWEDAARVFQEQELHLQKKQLMEEKQQALAALKDKLIQVYCHLHIQYVLFIIIVKQLTLCERNSLECINILIYVSVLFIAVCKPKEHIEEMSNISRAQLRMNNDDTDEPCAHLRSKDDELRQVQNNTAQCKDKTTARLAHKFELERCVICLFIFNFLKLND